MCPPASRSKTELVALRVTKLDPAIHDRGAFSCGNDAVDMYLRSTAAQAARYYRAASFVLERADDSRQVLGFYTLAQHEYRDAELNDITMRALKVRGLKRIPMVLLGQLGISTDWKGRGLGRYLLQDALRRSLAVAQEIGAVAMIADPVDDNARAFYAAFDFQLLHEAPFVRLLLPMRTIARALTAKTS